MDILNNLFSLGVIVAGIRIATPILLAGLGGLFTMQANILNIGMEGMMLFGAFSAVLVSYYTGFHRYGDPGGDCGRSLVGCDFWSVWRQIQVQYYCGWYRPQPLWDVLYHLFAKDYFSH